MTSSHPRVAHECPHVRDVVHILNYTLALAKHDKMEQSTHTIYLSHVHFLTSSALGGMRHPCKPCKIKQRFYMLLLMLLVRHWSCKNCVPLSTTSQPEASDSGETGSEVWLWGRAKRLELLWVTASSWARSRLFTPSRIRSAWPKPKAHRLEKHARGCCECRLKDFLWVLCLGSRKDV